MESNYQQTLDWLFSQLPMFSRVGAAAYKPGLETSEKLDEYFGHPHRQFKSIHIGGTNGKGSTSHMTASILQKAGYKTGLYTSPHLVDFRERIRINGEMISKEGVTDFIDRFRKSGYDGSPSFFELTMMMAFDWFAKNKVDYAVIEVGMGGRLDSTNIINPEMSVITNISKDHTQFLGETPEKIAAEKAGIIKKGVPVVIGHATGTVKEIFRNKAEEVGAPIIFGDDNILLTSYRHDLLNGWECRGRDIGEFEVPLSGDYQLENINTVLNACDVLRSLGLRISYESERDGFQDVILTTGLQGRWQVLSREPVVICDTGHNQAGLESTMGELLRLNESRPEGRLRLVVGFVNDKDVAHIVSLFPKDAEFYFTQASVPRAMRVDELSRHFAQADISGRIFSDVKTAFGAAAGESKPQDIIYVGGSTFVVADFLKD